MLRDHGCVNKEKGETLDVVKPSPQERTHILEREKKLGYPAEVMDISDTQFKILD